MKARSGLIPERRKLFFSEFTRYKGQHHVACLARDKTHRELQMFGQQILQLRDTLVDSVASLLLNQSVRQLVRLLRRVENVADETQATLDFYLFIYFLIMIHRKMRENSERGEFDSGLPCFRPASCPSGI